MRFPRHLYALALLLLAAPALAGSAGPAHLVRDLKTVGVDPFDPSSDADFNSYLAVNGRELWALPLAR